MASCEHCGTEFSPGASGEKFCCKGCEYVAELISEQGFEQFYDLKQGLAVAPVRSRPFEEHDFSWLAPKVAEAEGKAEARGGGHTGPRARGDFLCRLRVADRETLRAASRRHPRGGASVERSAASRMGAGKMRVGAVFARAVPVRLCGGSGGRGGGDHERRRLAARLGLCGAFALNTMGFSLPQYLGMPADFEFAALFRLIAFLSATLSMLVGGGYFIDRAWRAARAGSLHIDLPIALGLAAAYVGSIIGWMAGSERLMYFDFVSIFVFLMLGGRYLQTSAVERNRRRLVRQQPVPEAVPLRGRCRKNREPRGNRARHEVPAWPPDRRCR
jgi:P-type Cu2+ transporter